jgi:16S rRNA G527 N7-methylase RsmG
MFKQDHALEKFETLYAKDLILSHVGDDGRCYADDFKITNFFHEKYKTLVLDNKEFIKDRHLLDVGSNMGHWGLLAYLNGASSVTCLEPRGQYVDGLNKFSRKHNLKIQAIQGIHSDIFDWGKKFDVVMLSSIITSMPDVFAFFHRLRNITRYVIIKHCSLKNVPSDMCKMEKTHNITHRASVDLRTDDYLDKKSGTQFSVNDWSSMDENGAGVTFFWYYGTEYLMELFKYFNYKVIRFDRRPEVVSPDTRNLNDNQQFHDIVLEVV